MSTVVQRISKKLKEIVEYYTKDTAALSEINKSAITDLQQSVDALSEINHQITGALFNKGCDINRGVFG